MLKKILLAIVAIALIGGGTAYYMWNKPHDKVEDVKCISISAPQLAKEYQANENAANTKYLKKAIEVTGTVNEVDKNKDGGVSVILDTGDPMTGIQCSMRDSTVTATKGQNLVIKGFCSGNDMTGVILTDCVIKK